MFLFELDGTDPLSTKLIVLVNQLKADVENGVVDPSSYTTDEFLQYLQDKGDIVLDVTDLYNMIFKVIRLSSRDMMIHKWHLTNHKVKK